MSNYTKYIYLVFLFLAGTFLGLYISEVQKSYDDLNGIKTEILPVVSDIKNSEYRNLVSTPRLIEAYDILSDNYYKFNEKEKIALENGVIKGIVDSLGDKHSEFFTIDEAKVFHETLAGDFEGIGAVIGEESRGVIIEKIIPDSPAERAKLVAGDIITEVGGESIAGLTVQEAVKKIRGPKGTPVELKFYDPTTSEFSTKVVIRDSIMVPSISQKMLSGSIGYIEVSMFGEKTSGELMKALQTTMSESPNGIIIDLRYNGGGYLEEAVHMLSNFIPKDLPLVTTKETDPRKNDTLFSEGGIYGDIPLVFLVNDMSASASEIMVGAIQDYERGIVVGEKTYGKGSVQQPFVLSDGSELKITIAKWYTPKDRGIDGVGLTPDVEVRLTDEDYKTKYDRQLETAKEVLEEYVNSKDRSGTIQKFSTPKK